MSEDVLNPLYWRRRIGDAKAKHQAVYLTSTEDWEAIESRHREIIYHTIKPTDSILDAGCAWGRLLELMPVDWYGRYQGVDISPDFIQMARNEHPYRQFTCGNLANGSLFMGKKFDWAVLISIRPMIIGQCGQDLWNHIECNLRKWCHKLLFLEYDVNHGGSVE